MKRYDFYSTLIGILLFVCVAALIAIIMSCGTVLSTVQPKETIIQYPVFVDNGHSQDWLLTPYQDDDGEWQNIPLTTTGLQEWFAFGKVYTPSPPDDNLIEWHGYVIIDTGDSLIVIKNQ